jgi:hypothetical protein
MADKCRPVEKFFREYGFWTGLVVGIIATLFVGWLMGWVMF